MCKKMSTDASWCKKKQKKTLLESFGSVCHFSALALGDKVPFKQEKKEFKQNEQAKKPWFPVYTQTVKWSFPKALDSVT